MARPRNNIMRLPQPIRWRICELLEDGCTYDQVRADAEVAAACVERGLAIHGTTFLAFINGPGYAEYKKFTLERDANIEKCKMSAYLLEVNEASPDLARNAEYELLKICLDKLQSQDTLDAKELASISRVVAGYNRNLISQKKEDTKREFAEKEAEYLAKIAQMAAALEAQTQRLRDLAGDVDGNAVADALNKKLGL